MGEVAPVVASGIPWAVRLAVALWGSETAGFIYGASSKGFFGLAESHWYDERQYWAERPYFLVSRSA